jgi:hypothetical protein
MRGDRLTDDQIEIRIDDKAETRGDVLTALADLLIDLHAKQGKSDDRETDDKLTR